MWKIVDEVSWLLALLYILSIGFLERNYPLSLDYMRVVLIALMLIILLLYIIKLCKGIKRKQWRSDIAFVCLLCTYFLYF